MNKKTGKFLAVLVSAACVKYGMDAQKNIVANAAEQNNNTEISQATADNMGDAVVEETVDGQDAAVVTEVEAADSTGAEDEAAADNTEDAENTDDTDEEEIVPAGMTEEQIAASIVINKGQGCPSDYKLFGFDVSYDNSELLNHAYKGKGKYAIKDPMVRDSIETAVKSAWYGQLSLEDFQNILGYHEIDQGYVDVVTAKVYAKYAFKPEVKNIKTMETEITSALRSAKNGFDEFASGNTYGISEYDYGAISSSYYLRTPQDCLDYYGPKIEALNGTLQGRKFDTLKSLQEEIEKIENLYNKLVYTSDDITKEDLEFLGVTGFNDYNSDYIFKSIYKGRGVALNCNRMYGYVYNAAISIKDGYDEINNGSTQMCYYYAKIGDDIADDQSGAALAYALKGKNIRDEYTLRDKVEKIIGAYSDLKDRKDISISDLYTMGFENITEDAYPVVMENIKSTLENKNYNMNNSEICTAIEKCLDSSTKVFTKINDGTAEASDFDIFQMKNYYKVDEDNVKGISLALKGKNIEYNNDLYKAVNEAFDRYYRIGAGIADTSDYMAIGIDNLNDMTAKFVSYKIADMNLQSGCTLTINEIADKAYALSEQIGTAFENINDGTAAVDDFTGLEIDSVNDTNIDEVNALLKDKQCCTLEQVSDYLKSAGIGQLSEEEQLTYNRINAGIGFADDYKLLGITSITEDNLSDVNSYLKGKNCFNKVKLQKQVDLIVTALNNINSGSKVTEYYNMAGIDFVENSNVSAVAKSIKDAVEAKGSPLTVEEITVACENSITNMNALCDKLSGGNAEKTVYEQLGLEKVKDYNLSDINNVVKGIKSYDLVLIQNAIDSVADPLERIDKGTASVGDYNKLLIEGVTDDNLATVNNMVKADGQDKNNELSIAEAVAAVEKGIAKYNEIFATILSGTATAADYNYIGLDKINDNNIDDINAEVKKHNMSIKDMKTLRSYADVLANTLKLINEGTKYTSYYNYSWYGIQVPYTLDSKDINYVVDAILKAKAEKGRDLHKAEIIQIAKEVCEDVDAVYIRFDRGAATIEDFKSIGCVDFDESFLSDANAIARAEGYKDVDNIKKNVDILATLLNHAATGTVTYSELINFNVNYYFKLYSKNLVIINEKLKAASEEKGSNLTKAELKTIVESVLYSRY